MPLATRPETRDRSIGLVGWLSVSGGRMMIILKSEDGASHEPTGRVKQSVSRVPGACCLREK